MIARRWARILLVAAGCFFVPSCFSSDKEVTLQGAGATFPAPLYKRWFLEFYKNHPEVRTNYQAIGSGAGIRQFSADLIDFGATDEFKMPDVAGGAYLVPMTAGSIAICYNLPEGPKDLRLSRETYANIFLGKITDWNDDAIARDNPGVALPNTPITGIRRAESSGTTYAFTNHLNAICKDWHEDAGGPGKGKSIVWPKGFLGGKGNSGVAALIQQTPGAIGYLEFGYAVLAKIDAAQLQNKAGQFVSANPASGLAALGGSNATAIPDSLKIEIADPEGDAAYPIVTYTWVICHRKYANEKIGKTLKAVLEYCLTDGQKLSEEVHYLRLPREVAEKSLAMVRKIDVGN